MIEISAPTLEEAYTKAALDLDASIVDLEIEVVQNASSGFLGFFAKPAVIRASIKRAMQHVDKKPDIQRKHSTKKQKVEQVKEPVKEQNKIKYEIKEGLNRLLDASCFDVALVELRVDDEDVHIKLDGADVALLIGKEGYRYKALSYILHNWIKIKYNLNISLEIAEFLKNQEEMIHKYLENVKEKINQNGKAQTKPLDGILVKIALGNLREAYPEKYVAIRSLRDGRKIIVVNEYKRSHS
ncbi:MAG: Jag N-terminal domain-containing protein [Epsilonproteobacteria bacterium]|nr:Jag N-terminal domain-containing protein [Campylobacterota bacterium]